MMRELTSREARLYGHMHVAESGCWEWTGARNQGGYGVMGRGRRGEGNVLVHRAAWEEWRGPIPDGLSVLHRCDNRPCFNPEHLWLGTYADNNRDMAAKGRHYTQTRPELVKRGERHWAAKLSDADVRAIRTAAEAGEPLTSVARRFDMSPTTIGDITHRRSWTHV